MFSQTQTREAHIFGLRGKRIHRAPVHPHISIPSEAKRHENRHKMGATHYRFSKRLPNVALGLVLRCCSLPIVITVAIAIRMESRGNPLFIQTRIGLNEPYQDNEQPRGLPRSCSFEGTFLDAIQAALPRPEYLKFCCRSVGLLVLQAIRPTFALCAHEDGLGCLR